MRRSAPLATLTGLLAVTALAGTAVLPGAAQAAASDPAAYTSHGEVLNILPPGSRGNVDLTTLATLGVTNVPNLVSTPSDPADTTPSWCSRNTSMVIRGRVP